MFMNIDNLFIQHINYALAGKQIFILTNMYESVDLLCTLVIKLNYYTDGKFSLRAYRIVDQSN